MQEKQEGKTLLLINALEAVRMENIGRWPINRLMCGTQTPV